MARKRKYANIPTLWLDDPKIARLSDHEWREYVTNYALDPKNIKTEVYRHPTRKEFEKNRRDIEKIVFKIHGKICALCGSSKHPEIDHIIPIAKGGTNEISNLQVLCRKCNRSKGAR